MWIESDLSRPFFSNGTQIYHHGLDTEHGGKRALHAKKSAIRRGMLAADMIAVRYHEPSEWKLKIYTEIANGASLDTTSDRRWLRDGTPAGASQGPVEVTSNPSAGDSHRNPPQQQQNGAGEQSSTSWSSQFVTFIRKPNRGLGFYERLPTCT
ncbi:hypothetical protein BJY04DRAFT_199242 [Aspergillus karnatakaensis]|uniref:uncharacterized protein n=1 Tax=Aspergillus karnatakaensis TaxID=1810916 RepID=UPI003CCDC0FE